MSLRTCGRPRFRARHSARCVQREGYSGPMEKTDLVISKTLARLGLRCRRDLINYACRGSMSASSRISPRSRRSQTRVCPFFQTMPAWQWQSDVDVDLQAAARGSLPRRQLLHPKLRLPPRRPRQRGSDKPPHWSRRRRRARYRRRR